MESDDDRQQPPASSPSEPTARPQWLRGAVISVIGVLIGTVAFVLFCYALGLNFSDEGWADNGKPWQTNRGALIGSLVGIAVAILVFWLGFIQITRVKS